MVSVAEHEVVAMRAHMLVSPHPFLVALHAAERDWFLLLHFSTLTRSIQTEVRPTMSADDGSE
jgi:hypothetical protein